MRNIILMAFALCLLLTAPAKAADAEVAKGFDDIAAGRKRSLAQARADLAQEFGV